MKIRHPLLLKWVGLLGSWLIRVYMATLHYRYRAVGPVTAPKLTDRSTRYIYAFWHENLLLAYTHHLGPQTRVLISQHADGEIIAEAARHVRAGTIRGSATRGGIEATRQLMRASERYHLGVVPDGPKGPRRKIKPGLIYLAARTGLGIVVGGIGYNRPWRLRTWDRFAVPRPFSGGVVVTLPPVYVPADLPKEQYEPFCRILEQRMDDGCRLAEIFAETGRWPAAEEARLLESWSLPLRRSA